MERLPAASRLLKLSQKFGAARLEAACARALHFGDPAYKTIKQILTEGLDRASLPSVVTPPPAVAFVRSPDELVGHLVGGAAWN